FTERKFFGAYQEAYEDVLTRCSTAWAPWYIIPANRKWYRNVAVLQIIVDTLEGLKMKFPAPTIDLRKYRLERPPQSPERGTDARARTARRGARHRRSVSRAPGASGLSGEGTRRGSRPSTAGPRAPRAPLHPCGTQASRLRPRRESARG